jgi:phospholipid transport system substrate-binding protein
MTRNFPSIGRRDLLNLAIPAAVVAVAWRPSVAATANDLAPVAPVERLNAALVAAMKAGRGTPFAQRYAALAPVLEQTFDLDAALTASVGLRWPALPDDQKTLLRAAFRRYTVASYAANFDNFAGQTFRVSPMVREVGDGDVVVGNQLVSGDGSTTSLDYVMRNGQSGWRAVDVLANGSISRVAVQRSDFRSLLTSGGVPALVAALTQKVASLSGGMTA